MSSPVSALWESAVHSTGQFAAIILGDKECGRRKETLNRMRQIQRSHEHDESMLNHYFLTNWHLLRALHSREIISQVKGRLYWFDADDKSRICWRWNSSPDPEATRGQRNA